MAVIKTYRCQPAPDDADCRDRNPVMQTNQVLWRGRVPQPVAVRAFSNQGTGLEKRVQQWRAS